MLIPRIKITFIKPSFDEYVFDFVNELEIEESFEHLTNTAKISLPRNINYKGIPIFNGEKQVFSRGDQVRIEAGYYPQMRPIFTGWIASVGSGVPIEIMCEDDMFLLKNTPASYPDKSKLTFITSSKNGKKRLKRPKVITPTTTLDDLLNYILPDDIHYECLDMNLGRFRASNTSVAKILDYLLDEYGLFSSFKDGILYVGFQSNAGETNTEEFEFERNIFDDHSLEFQKEEDIKIQVKVISINDNNAKTSVERGDADGAVRTFHVYNSTEADMIKYADLKLNELRYTGFIGDFTTFGEPYVRPGDIAKIVSKKYPEGNGSYLIPTVKRYFGQGYKQTISITNRA